MKLNASRIKKQWQALASFVVLDFFYLSSERVVLSVVVVYLWCFPWGRESRSGVVYFRLASSLPIVTRRRSIASSDRPVDRPVDLWALPSVFDVLALLALGVFLLAIAETSSSVQSIRIQKSRNTSDEEFAKKNGKEQCKRNEELRKRQPKVLRLASVDLERSDKNVRLQRQSPKKDAIEKTRSSLLCFGLHTRLEWLPKLTTGNQNMATKTLSESGE